MAALGNRRLVARTVLALLSANARYWSTVAVDVHGQLRRWERRAGAIDDPALRELALGKLRDERFNAEAGAMLATLAPRARRGDVVEAIVALEVLFDYLDGLTERPCADPLGDGERLFAAFTDAVSVSPQTDRPGNRDQDPAAQAQDRGPTGERLRQAQAEGDPCSLDGGYLQALSDTVARALARLPAAGAIAEVAQASAARSAQAQIRMHAARTLGIGQLQEWATLNTQETGLGWRELAAGAASSVLAIHALIAAAADPATTPAQAVAIEAAYLEICVVLTLLDGLVDHERDSATARVGYISLYEDRDQLAWTLTSVARRAVSRAGELANGAHHVMTFVGVVAYYTSDPGAEDELARPIAAQLKRQLTPLISPTLTVMALWRWAKRLRSSATSGSPARQR